MKGTDRFLIAIVMVAVALAAAAIAVMLLRPKPSYRQGATPDAAVHNYLLALQQEDYERAFLYLSPTIEGYPRSPQAFEEAVRDNSWQFRLGDTSAALEVLSARIVGERATVTVQETSFYQGGLFDSSQRTSTFEMRLRRDLPKSAWLLVESDSYWAWCWNDQKGCG